MGKLNPLIAFGLPTWGRVTVSWARAYKSLGGPLGANGIEIVVEQKPIAEARNQLMAQAIANNADYLFMLGDDVLAPPSTIVDMLARMKARPDIHLLTGVYWTKSGNPLPYLWKGLQQGPYLDWKMGEFFELDMAGCDCLLIRLSDEVKALGPDWFSTDWVWEEKDGPPSALTTEDFYFYTKARAAGLKLWCDSSIQCLHEDRQTGAMYGLRADMPQVGALPPTLPAGEARADGLVYVADVGCGFESPNFGPSDKVKLVRFDANPGVEPDYRCDVRTLPAGEARADGLVYVADVGCGFESPNFGPSDKVKLVRFDANPGVEPDYRCDVRTLPAEDQSFDVVHARHVLEHFGRDELVPILTEWTRILRVGGELRLGVPNLLSAIRWIERMDKGETPPDPYPFWQLYGAQVDQYDYHKNGFTARRLQLILERVGVFEEVVVEEVDDGVNLAAKARKARHPKPYALLPVWEEIAQREGATFAGLNTETEQAGSPAEET